MYNHNKAQQSKNRVHISWDILYPDHLQNWLDFGRALSMILIMVSIIFGVSWQYLENAWE